ncbi:MAG: cell division protein CrgA [Bifidobacteriaceae bacterium]|nr:cell division protein CrgA [Bifidobacteriaceae bacterium]
MPESRSREKKSTSYTPPPGKQGVKPSPKWWAPLMVVLMLVGLAYVVLTYLQLLVPSALGNWNLGIGFAVLLIGFLMTMRWR